MYCPNCGAESTQGLNYCKRCGGNLYPPATNGSQEIRPTVSTGTAWGVGVSMLLLISVGMIILFGMMSELSFRVPGATIVAIMVCGSLTILGSVFMLTRFWMRLLTGTTNSDAQSRIAMHPSATAELGPARVSALPDVPFTSVTEHTTRTLKQGGRMKAEG